MTTWELAEKPRRKGRQFAVRITKQGDVFIIRLVYYGRKPYDSLGYLDREYTNGKESARELAGLMLRDLKRGKFDRQIADDLKTEDAWRKMGRVIR